MDLPGGANSKAEVCLLQRMPSPWLSLSQLPPVMELEREGSLKMLLMAMQKHSGENTPFGTRVPVCIGHNQHLDLGTERDQKTVTLTKWE